MNSRLALVVGVGLALLSPALSPASAPADEPTACGAPVAGLDGWSIATPQSVGLEPRRLCALIGWLDGLRDANVHGVVVVRRGSLVFEHYRKGQDQRWGMPIGEVAYGPVLRHDVRSISKSVVSLLVGIALDRKLIAGIDGPVSPFFPEYADLRTPDRDRILLRHLLTMSAGFAWNETNYTDPANSEIRMTFAPDPYRFVLEQAIATPPGEKFTYSGGATALLGRIVEKVSGKPLEEFARETLFGPLGITDVEWVKMPNGDAAAASGLRLRPRDVARLGQLMLAHGKWDGRQIVSAQWLQDSTTPQIEAADFLLYGYQWWLGRFLVDRREVPWVAGLGLGGQRLFVVPALDLVVVVTSGMYTSPMQRWVPWTLVRDYAVAAIRRD